MFVIAYLPKFCCCVGGGGGLPYPGIRQLDSREATSNAPYLVARVVGSYSAVEDRSSEEGASCTVIGAEGWRSCHSGVPRSSEEAVAHRIR